MQFHALYVIYSSGIHSVSTRTFAAVLLLLLLVTTADLPGPAAPRGRRGRHEFITGGHGALARPRRVCPAQDGRRRRPVVGRSRVAAAVVRLGPGVLET